MERASPEKNKLRKKCTWKVHVEKSNGELHSPTNAPFELVTSASTGFALPWRRKPNASASWVLLVRYEMSDENRFWKPDKFPTWAPKAPRSEISSEAGQAWQEQIGACPDMFGSIEGAKTQIILSFIFQFCGESQS